MKIILVALLSLVVLTQTALSQLTREDVKEIVTASERVVTAKLDAQEQRMTDLRNSQNTWTGVFSGLMVALIVLVVNVARKLGALESRLTSLESRFTSLESRFTSMEDTLKLAIGIAQKEPENQSSATTGYQQPTVLDSQGNPYTVANKQRSH